MLLLQLWFAVPVEYLWAVTTLLPEEYEVVNMSFLTADHGDFLQCFSTLCDEDLMLALG